MTDILFKGWETTNVKGIKFNFYYFLHFKAQSHSLAFKKSYLLILLSLNLMYACMLQMFESCFFFYLFFFCCSFLQPLAVTV